MTTYEKILTEVGTEFRAFKIKTAKKYVPELWKALKNENPNLIREELRDRLERDCLKFWGERTILMALPDEAKDPTKQKFTKLSQKNRISAAMIAAQPEPNKQEIVIDTVGRPIKNDTSSPSPNGKGSQLHDKEDLLKFEFSIPIADIWAPIYWLSAWKEDVIWFEVVFSIGTGKVISTTVGEQTRQIIAEKSQEYTQSQ